MSSQPCCRDAEMWATLKRMKVKTLEGKKVSPSQSGCALCVLWIRLVSWHLGGDSTDLRAKVRSSLKESNDEGQSPDSILEQDHRWQD